MAGKNHSPRIVQTDLATMLSIMQELCLDDEDIVACVAEMMHKGVIRKTPFNNSLHAAL